jgi:ribosomal protein S18 acetylase RimI-like enzyme
MAVIRCYNDSDYKDVKYNLEEAKLYIPMWDNRENLKEKIKRNPDSIIIAEEDNHAIGNLFLIEDGWSAFIFHVAVRSDYRQKGIGQKLLSYAEDNLKRQGVKAVSLFVNENLNKVQNFYKKQGYLSIENYLGMYKLL